MDPEDPSMDRRSSVSLARKIMILIFMILFWWFFYTYKDNGGTKKTPAPADKTQEALPGNK
ncbi:MAG: hypothetical protein HY580_07845 [Nitrospinae bacterium]|nr:hypothetical protein [Nitrospinota bacterium]